MLDRYHQSTEQDIEQQWLAEAQARLAAYDRGELIALDGEQVLAELRLRFNG